MAIVRGGDEIRVLEHEPNPTAEEQVPFQAMMEEIRPRRPAPAMWFTTSAAAVIIGLGCLNFALMFMLYGEFDHLLEKGEDRVRVFLKDLCRGTNSNTTAELEAMLNASLTACLVTDDHMEHWRQFEYEPRTTTVAEHLIQRSDFFHNCHQCLAREEYARLNPLPPSNEVPANDSFFTSWPT